jgi:hypothetical protein
VKRGTKRLNRKPPKRRADPAPPSTRLPLPSKGEKHHGDETKYERSREKQRLRRDFDV